MSFCYPEQPNMSEDKPEKQIDWDDWDHLPVSRVSGPEVKNAPYPLAKGENLVQCPYDANHKVLDYKAHTHFNKCRRQYIKKCQVLQVAPKFTICRHNQLHHVLIKELEEHYKNCVDAKEYRDIMNAPPPDYAPQFGSNSSKNTFNPPVKNEPSVSHGKFDVCDGLKMEDGEPANEEETGESWENLQEPKFDFIKHQQRKFFTKQPVGLTKSEKKDRMEEVLERRNLRDSRHERQLAKLEATQVKPEGDSWE